MATEEGRPFAALPAVVRLNEIRIELDISQEEMGRRLDCSQPTMSDVLQGKARFRPVRRALVRRVFGVPLDAWLTAEERDDSTDANDASQCEEPQAAQVFISGSPEACSASANAA